ncbi:MAG TPA: hypothetical protein VGO03_14400 [Acidimicrobiia bacterium]|jgi:hypothetical protein
MTMTLDGPVTDTETISDEELTALALAAHDDDIVPDDAVPFMAFGGDDGDALLPSWYMPAASAGGNGKAQKGWRRIAVLAVIVAFLTIDCYGMCNTYGDLHVSAHTPPAHHVISTHR